jgi:hypothetical protein
LQVLNHDESLSSLINQNIINALVRNEFDGREPLRKTAIQDGEFLRPGELRLDGYLSSAINVTPLVILLDWSET